MQGALDLEILTQPDDITCGPTCLQAVYRYHGLHLGLEEVIASTARLNEGGTLAVMLGIDALRRGFEATIYTFNLVVFDPTWFGSPAIDLAQRLRSRRAAKAADPKLVLAVDAYLEYLERGGILRYEDLTTGLLRRHLKQGVPVLTGLSATYLYRSSREVLQDRRFRDDDVNGDPQGHFVVLCGYDPDSRGVLVADPLQPNPNRTPPKYVVNIDRLVCSILLGVMTYDANLLVVQPRRGETDCDR